jgi:hypothetical protein
LRTGCSVLPEGFLRGRAASRVVNEARESIGRFASTYERQPPADLMEVSIMKKFALGFAVLGLLAAACSSSSTDGAKDPDGADTAAATADTAAPATTDTAAPATTDTAAPATTDTAAPATK